MQNHFINRPTNSIIYSDEFTVVQLPLQYLIQEETKAQKRALGCMKVSEYPKQSHSALGTQGESLSLSLEHFSIHCLMAQSSAVLAAPPGQAWMGTERCV